MTLNLITDLRPLLHEQPYPVGVLVLLHYLKPLTLTNPKP